MSKVDPRIKRKNRIRRKLSGTTERPRLTVYKSLKHIYAQVVDDSTGKAVNVSAVVFDRNGFPYQGRIAAVADAAREAGLQF